MHGNIDILLHPKGATPLANSAEPGEEDAAPSAGAGEKAKRGKIPDFL